MSNDDILHICRLFHVVSWLVIVFSISCRFSSHHLFPFNAVEEVFVIFHTMCFFQDACPFPYNVFLQVIIVFYPLFFPCSYHFFFLCVLWFHYPCRFSYSHFPVHVVFTIAVVFIFVSIIGCSHFQIMSFCFPWIQEFNFLPSLDRQLDSPPHLLRMIDWSSRMDSFVCKRASKSLRDPSKKLIQQCLMLITG